MTATEQVTLAHPKLPGAAYTCPASQVWVWQEAGWRPKGADDATPGPAKNTKTPAAASATSKES